MITANGDCGSAKAQKGAIMITLTTWNMKGGTGKTTTTFNVATNYAKQGKRVLLLDLDIQANLTSYFDLDLAHRAGNGKPDIAELINNNLSIRKGIYHSRFKNLHFIKGSNNQIVPYDISQISKMLSTIKDDYDICMIDCHPDNSLATQNAIAASNLVIIPILLDGFSRDNLNLVVREIINIENITGYEIDFRIIVNRLRNLRSQGIIYSDLAQNHDYPILNTSISEYSGIQSALLYHKPVYMHRSKSGACKDYIDLATEILENVRRM